MTLQSLTEKIQKGNVRFPRLNAKIDYGDLKVKRPEENQIEEIKIRNLDVDMLRPTYKLINDIEEDIRKTNVDFINSWLMDMIKEYGVKKEEIKDRVMLYTMGMNVLHQTHHVFIDGYYVFSFKQGCDFAENGQSYTAWVKPEYISEMSGGIL